MTHTIFLGMISRHIYRTFLTKQCQIKLLLLFKLVFFEILLNKIITYKSVCNTCFCCHYNNYFHIIKKTTILYVVLSKFVMSIFRSSVKLKKTFSQISLPRWLDHFLLLFVPVSSVFLNIQHSHHLLNLRQLSYYIPKIICLCRKYFEKYGTLKLISKVTILGLLKPISFKNTNINFNILLHIYFYP